MYKERTARGELAYADRPAKEASSLTDIGEEPIMQLLSSPTADEWAGSLPSDAVYLRNKRLFDILVASCLIFLAAPFIAVLALLITLEDRGPIVYRQLRVGRNGRLFWFLKLRSMYVNADAAKAQLLEQNEADGPLFKMKEDPRITRVGRFIRKYSLDELPQLFCVLKGEMSVIGPRPHLPSEVEHYAPHHYDRLRVQPGLLCLREVSGRSKLTFEQWLDLDLEYVRTRSFKMDAKILMKAVPAVLKADGAY